MTYNKLTKKQKQEFNQILLDFGYKVDTALGMVLPTNQFGTRKSHDGLQPHTTAGKKVRKYQQQLNK